MPSIGISPPKDWSCDETLITSSWADCQAPAKRCSASLGSNSSAPGGTTRASNFHSLPSALMITLGRARGGKSVTTTIRTSVPSSLHRSISPAKSKSDRKASAVWLIDIASGPPCGLGVRRRRQPGVGCCGARGSANATAANRPIPAARIRPIRKLHPPPEPVRRSHDPSVSFW